MVGSEGCQREGDEEIGDLQERHYLQKVVLRYLEKEHANEEMQSQNDVQPYLQFISVTSPVNRLGQPRGKCLGTVQGLMSLDVQERLYMTSPNQACDYAALGRLL